MKILIIGAGPAGMTAAYRLAKNNFEVDVYEADNKVGGLSKSLTLWNQIVDIGPHRFFCNDKRVNALWLDVVGSDFDMVDRLTRIYYKKHFFNYPLKPFNALLNMGFFEAFKCFVSYSAEYFSPTGLDGSFESWVKSRFGKRLFEMFFKTYTEKLWGIKCTELDADFAAQRIKKLSLYEAIKNAVLNGKKNTHKTLVDQFAYPLYGTGMVYERMTNFIRQSGNNVYLNTPVHRVITQNNKVKGVELEGGGVRECDHVISSMPYTQMVERLPEVPETIKQLASQLTYRNTIIVYLLINSTEIFPDNWIYIHSPELQMGRITNFRNWLPNLYGTETKSILAVEYWCNDGDELWRSTDKKLIQLSSTEIIKTQLIKPGLIENGHVHRIPKSYPVYKKGYKEILKPVEKYVSSIQNLYTIGRYGSFKYNNQDHSILMGLLAAENITDGAKHNLSEINTDYDSYQESYIITKTGLHKQ